MPFHVWDLEKRRWKRVLKSTSWCLLHFLRGSETREIRLFGGRVLANRVRRRRNMNMEMKADNMLTLPCLIPKWIFRMYKWFYIACFITLSSNALLRYQSHISICVTSQPIKLLPGANCGVRFLVATLTVTIRLSWLKYILLPPRSHKHSWPRLNQSLNSLLLF